MVGAEGEDSCRERCSSGEKGELCLESDMDSDRDKS